MQEPLNGMYKLEKHCINERWAEILGYTLAELEPINDELC
jgi:hypothetical protein